MLFNRRKKPAFLDKLFSIFWPKTGWTRAWKYILLRIQRLPGTPSSIAKGFACGVAVSFTPFVGIHIILCVTVSWLISGNALAAVIGTAIGNPWTFPIIWILILNTGKVILPATYVIDNVNFVEFFQSLMNSVITFNVDLFVENVWPILLTMIVGSIPFVISSWVITYFLIRNFILKFKELRKLRIKIKQKQFLKKRQRETLKK